MNQADEAAKAVKEVAKTAGKAIDLADKAGGFISRYFSGAMEHLGGAAKDSAYGFRIRNFLRVMEKTDKRLRDAGIDTNFRKISERNAVPLLEALASESDDMLQDVWAKLLANALDPNRTVSLNRNLIDAVKRLEPIDVETINRLFQEDLEAVRPETLTLTPEDFPALPMAELLSSLSRLNAVGLMLQANTGFMIVTEDTPGEICRVEVDTNVGSFRTSYMLLELKRALQD